MNHEKYEDKGEKNEKEIMSEKRKKKGEAALPLLNNQ